MQVICGVHQRPILGLLLFIIYINDITKLSSIVKLILFAEDTNIFKSGPDIEKLVECVNSELEKSLTGLELTSYH